MIRRPSPLAPGARVALIAPAGALREPIELERALANARDLGWEPVPAPNVLARAAYLAGDDRGRVADLNGAALDPSIDAVWCVRGGYGSMRLLAALDYDAWRRRPKPLIGFSDVTALHAAIGTRAGIVTYHGPTARQAITPFSRDALVRAIAGERTPRGPIAGGRTLVRGRARGRVVGGNLALLAALSGTPFAPDYDGAILVLEDVNEAVYRIDRMLVQLRLAGALGRCAGIVFGQFTGVPDDDTSHERTVDDVLAEIAEAVGVPAVANAPFGHIDDQWTLPLGATAELDADALTLDIID